MRPFLTANWTNLINITYAVDPAMLMPYLPKGVKLDVLDGKAFVSLVPFDFTDTRSLGIKFPFHVNFPEINFRFYVNFQGKRGVVFISEFVSKRIIAAIARNFYYEQYKFTELKSIVAKNEKEIKVKHILKKGSKIFEVEAAAEDNLYFPDKNSKEFFFEERFYGYSKNSEGETMEFRVEHTPWRLFSLKSYNINFDYGFLLGKEWSFLNDAAPESVMLINGSSVKMYPHQKINPCTEARLLPELEG